MPQQGPGDPRYHHYHSRYEHYNNHGFHASHGATQIIQNARAPTVFDILEPHVVHDALYNSRQRQNEHAVTCLPETRTQVLDDIEHWANDTTSTPIVWLHGPAGTGKTTVTHTIAKKYDDGRLAASFFFWRKTEDRNDINKLVPTLAYQIAKRNPSAREQMERILELDDPSQVALTSLLSRYCLEDQLEKLLVRGHVTNPNTPVPDLIVIDGLDECDDQEGIFRLIKWVRTNRSPYRFLLASRPEPGIRRSFTSSQDIGQSNVPCLSLTESKSDIRKYFLKELEELWPKHERIRCGEPSGPSAWPSNSDLNKLVEKSEGLFVYAATAVRHIKGKGAPDNRLKDVLKLHNGLDDLYIQVIKEAMEWDHCDIVLGALMYLRYPLSINDLFTNIHAVDGRLVSQNVFYYALHGCHSILAIPDFHTPIESHHASLRDFLIDPSRSKDFFRAPSPSHGRLMYGCLSAITRAFSDRTNPPEYALISWQYHACFFLSAAGNSDELEGLNHAIQVLFEEIDLKWVINWMKEALCWAGVPYFLPSTQDLPDTYWTRLLEPKLRIISDIVKNFLTYIDDNPYYNCYRRKYRHNINNNINNNFNISTNRVIDKFFSQYQYSHLFTQS